MKNVSKFGLGAKNYSGSPSLTVMKSEGTRLNWSNLTLCPKSSMPSKVKISMQMSRRMEKVVISLIVSRIVCRSSRNDFQLLANLKTLNSLMPRKAERALAWVELMSGICMMMKSTRETITMTASKMLNGSLAYSLNPKPISLRSISKTKNQMMTSLIISATYCLSELTGYESNASTMVLRMMRIVVQRVNKKCVLTE